MKNSTAIALITIEDDLQEDNLSELKRILESFKEINKRYDYRLQRIKERKNFSK